MKKDSAKGFEASIDQLLRTMSMSRILMTTRRQDGANVLLTMRWSKLKPKLEGRGWDKVR